MVETRPDWCISRQRAWGVPIAVFIHRKTGEPLRDPAVVERIAAAFERDGADAWFSADAAQFLGNGYDPAEYEKVTDIVEVWFDSGSTHAFVLEQRPELRWPASLYLEGSDQHRGWFHSSLLEACGTRGRAPYDAVLTHGFVLDEEGRKMSKSLGNVVAPQDVMQQSGADILRLWVVGSDYSEDLRIGPEILKHQSDVYRRLRNTLRYLLGALDGFTPGERVGVEAMPELERWVLHRLAELDSAGPAARSTPSISTASSPRCTISAQSISRRFISISARTRSIATRPAASGGARCAPCSTASSTVWCAGWRRSSASPPRRPGSPAMATPRSAASISNNSPRCRPTGAIAALARALGGAARSAPRRHRRDRTRARAKRLGSSLQAAIEVFVPDRLAALAADIDLAELCITSAATVAVGPVPEDAFTLSDLPGIGVRVSLAAGEQCERCWRVLPEVGHAPGHADLCLRCAAAIDRRDDVACPASAG